MEIDLRLLVSQKVNSQLTVAPDGVSIAGSRKIRHWTNFRSKLPVGVDQKLWQEAFSEYFRQRICLAEDRGSRSAATPSVFSGGKALASSVE
jgi:hypothetical protein